MNTPLPPSSFPPASFQPEPLLAVACPACFGAIAVGTDLLGRAADCPLCGQGFNVPLPAVTTPPPLATPVNRPMQAISKESRQRPDSPRSIAKAGHAEQPGSHERKRRDPHDGGVQTSVPEGAPTHPARARDLQFEEPVRTISSGGQVITLRRLTPEEKAIRRGRRNLIMMLSGVSILMAIVLLLGTKRSRRRS